MCSFLWQLQQSSSNGYSILGGSRSSCWRLKPHATLTSCLASFVPWIWNSICIYGRNCGFKSIYFYSMAQPSRETNLCSPRKQLNLGGHILQINTFSNIISSVNINFKFNGHARRDITSGLLLLTTLRNSHGNMTLVPPSEVLAAVYQKTRTKLAHSECSQQIVNVLLVWHNFVLRKEGPW